MDEKSTTVVDNPSDDASKSTTVTDPAATTDIKTADTSDNLDPSKSDDTSVADDDKKSETTTKTNDAPASEFDADIDDWAEKRFGAKPATDEQRKAYQESRNEQRDYTKAQQAKRESADAKALEDEINSAKPKAADDDDDVDPVERDVKDLKEKYEAQEVTRLQSEFYQSNKVSEDEGKVIVDVFKEKMAKATTPEAKKAAFDFWSKPGQLSDLLEIAKARIANGSDAASIAAEEAARKERERIAKESQANSPGRGAKTTTSGEKTPEQQRLERFTNW